MNKNSPLSYKTRIDKMYIGKLIKAKERLQQRRKNRTSDKNGKEKEKKTV